MFGLSSIKLVLVGLGAVGVLGFLVYVQHLRHSVAVLTDQKAALEQQVDLAVATAETNADALAAVSRQSDVNEKLVRDAYEDRLKAAEKKTKLLEDIAHASPEDDAPAAPVLDRTVRSLYGTETDNEAHP